MTDTEILQNQIEEFNKELLEQLSALKDRIERLEEYIKYSSSLDNPKENQWLDYTDTSVSKRGN